VGGGANRSTPWSESLHPLGRIGPLLPAPSGVSRFSFCPVWLVLRMPCLFRRCIGDWHGVCAVVGAEAKPEASHETPTGSGRWSPGLRADSGQRRGPARGSAPQEHSRAWADGSGSMTSEMELVVDTGGAVRCIYDEDGQGRSLGRSTLVIDPGSIYGGRSAGRATA